MRLTIDRLNEVLEYDARTGIFNWRVTKKSAKNGGTAGSLDTYGYVQIKIDRKMQLAHRLAWAMAFGVWPKKQVDHLNHIRNDNRIINLREVTAKENMRNLSKPKNNSSGTVGVYWDKHADKWKASINIDGKSKHLGLFTNQEDAILCREAANIEYGFHSNHGQ